MLTMIAEQIVNGMVSGSVYAIVAVGMTMIFGVLRAINFAHGEYYMLGTFGAWFAIEYLELPYPVALVIGVIATAVIAVVVGKFVMQRIVGAPPETGVLATLGIALVLQNTVILVFGGGYKFFSGGYIEPVSIFGFTLAEHRVHSGLRRAGTDGHLQPLRQGDARGIAEHRVLRGRRHRRAPGGASDIHSRSLSGSAVRRADGPGERQRLWRHGGDHYVQDLAGHHHGRAWQRPRHALRGDDTRYRGKPGGDLCRPAVPRHRWIRDFDAGSDVASPRAVLDASPVLIATSAERFSNCPRTETEDVAQRAHIASTGTQSAFVVRDRSRRGGLPRSVVSRQLRLARVDHRADLSPASTRTEPARRLYGPAFPGPGGVFLASAPIRPA